MKRLLQTVQAVSHPAVILKVLRRGDVSSAGLVTMASIAGQTAALSAYPILTRIFTQEAFGIFAVMTSVSVILSAVSALCYDMSIIVPRSPRVAAALFRLSLAAGVVTMTALAAVLLATQQFWMPEGWSSGVGTAFILCLVIASWATGLSFILGPAHAKFGAFKGVAAMRVTMMAFPAAGQIALGLLSFGAAGLMAGYAAGRITAALLAFRTLPGLFKRSLTAHWRYTDLRAAARLYRDTMLHIPRQILMRGSHALPPILVAIAYGPETAALFFLAQRVIDQPGTLLDDALCSVPLGKFAEKRARKEAMVPLGFGYTMAIGGPVILGVGILALTAPFLFSFIFGSQWADAADYAIYLGVLTGIRLMTMPMRNLVTVLRIQNIAVIIDGIFALRVLVIPLFAYWGEPSSISVAAFCMISVVYYISVWALCVYHALKHDRSLIPKTV